MGRLSREETEARRQRVRELLASRPYVQVGELVAQLGISEATARRDLASLADQQLIHRTHGGAIGPRAYARGLGEYEALFPAFEQRRAVNVMGKKAIAAEAAGMIQDGMTVYIDAGSTCLTLAETLRETGRSVTVVTINLGAAIAVGQTEGIQVELLGGRVLGRQAVVVDERGEAALADWNLDLAFISAEGFDRAGVWNSQETVVALQRGAMKRAAKTIALLDQQKLNQDGPVKLCNWLELDHVITDASEAAIKQLLLPVTVRLV